MYIIQFKEKMKISAALAIKGNGAKIGGGGRKDGQARWSKE